MKYSYTVALVCLTALAPTILGLIQPALDARANFATNFYRLYDHHAKSSGSNVVVSPAAIQKLLTVVYGAAEYGLADEMLWDMRLKHIDPRRLFAEAQEEGVVDIGFAPHLTARQLKELGERIPREDVFDYFRSDFSELDDAIKVENYIAAPKELQFDSDFIEFAQNYFSVELVNKETDAVAKIEKTFGYVLNETEHVELLSAISLKTRFKNDFLENGNTLTGRGKFRAGIMRTPSHSTFEAQVLELPLAVNPPDHHTQLSMLFIMPQTTKFFEYLLSQVMGRSLSDFNDISNTLTEQELEIKLPKIDLDMETNLAGYFQEISTKGVKRIFSENVKLESMFVKLPEDGIKVDSFWLKSSLHITAKKFEAEHDQNATSAVESEPAEVFDATSKPFFFVIKSDKVLYFMGHVAKLPNSLAA